jgi:hypothetical protein
LAALKLATDDLKDEAFGRWHLDFDTDTMTLYRADGTVLKTFQLTRTTDSAPNYIERTPA